MKAIRKITENNKGLVAFLLVFFFLAAALTKGLVSKAASGNANEKSQVSSKCVLGAENDDESSLNFTDQLKDADGDDVECTLNNNQCPPGLIIGQAPKAVFTDVSLCKDTATVPLYDLYCNWKLAIS